MLLLLDSGPLGRLCNPVETPPTSRVRQWAEERLVSGHRLAVPAVADYEVRRELQRAGRSASVRRLDELIDLIGYAAIDRHTWTRAAGLWAHSRRSGSPTAADGALDADVLLAATALQLSTAGDNVAVATGNARHLARYCPVEIVDLG